MLTYVKIVIKDLIKLNAVRHLRSRRELLNQEWCDSRLAKK